MPTVATRTMAHTTYLLWPLLRTMAPTTSHCKVGQLRSNKPALLTMAVLTMAVLTMAVRTMAPLTMALLTMALLTKVGQLRSNKPATLYSTDSYVVAVCVNQDGTPQQGSNPRLAGRVPGSSGHVWSRPSPHLYPNPDPDPDPDPNSHPNPDPDQARRC